MVSITREAVAKAQQIIASAGTEPTEWFLIVAWAKGVADNQRTAEGGVAWTRQPDGGWVVQLGAWKPGKVPPEQGIPLFGDVRLLIENSHAPHPFTGGEIYVEADELKVKVHAI